MKKASKVSIFKHQTSDYAHQIQRNNHKYNQIQDSVNTYSEFNLFRSNQNI